MQREGAAAASALAAMAGNRRGCLAQRTAWHNTGLLRARLPWLTRDEALISGGIAMYPALIAPLYLHVCGATARATTAAAHETRTNKQTNKQINREPPQQARPVASRADGRAGGRRRQRTCHATRWRRASVRECGALRAHHQSAFWKSAAVANEPEFASPLVRPSVLNLCAAA